MELPAMALSLLFGVLSCLLALVAGYPFVRALRALGIGKAIQVELPAGTVLATGTRHGDEVRLEERTARSRP